MTTGCICLQCGALFVLFIFTVADLVYSSVVETSGRLRGNAYTTRVDGEQIVRLLDSSYGPASSPITGLIYAMDFDLQRGVLYYGDRNGTSIWRVSLRRLTGASDDRQRMLQGVTAWGMAYDWINDDLYWSDDR